MIILCAGTARSGSTWQYNAVRIVAQAKYGDAYGAWIDTYDASRPESVHVIKVHSPLQALTINPDKIVTCFRDLRDVVASLNRMKWAADTSQDTLAETLDSYIATLAHWRKRSDFTMRYEDMRADPIAMLQHLNAALEFQLTPEELAAAFTKLSAIEPPSGDPAGTAANFDPDSLLHQGHIGGDGGAPLSVEAKAFIEDRYAAWLQDHGYIKADIHKTPYG